MSKKSDQDPKDDSQKKSRKSSVKVSDKLKQFDIEINSFGEIISNYDVDKINDFLNKNVEDKKLKNRKDIDQIKGKSEEDSDADSE